MNTIGMMKPTGYVGTIAPQQGPSGAGEKVSSSFSDIFKNAIDQVNEQQHTASALNSEFQAGGDVELHTVMASMETAKISFQTLNAARNKVVQAYQSVMNMNI
jgi:flagellar hook-basal body complex protein FliE